MDRPEHHLACGFNWLGGATIFAKVIDFSATLAVLLFMTNDQVGIAVLMISVGMMIETFNGLGTSGFLLIQVLRQNIFAPLRASAHFRWAVNGVCAFPCGHR